MNQLATITSKKQLTLPAGIFREAGLKIGQRVMVTQENGNLLIAPAKSLVEELAGSLTLPKRWKKKSLDRIIEEAKSEHFR